MKADKILVVDADPARRKQVATLLHFLGQSEVEETEPGQWRECGDPAALKAVFVGYSDSPQVLAGEAAALVAWAGSVPLFAVGPGGGELPEGVLARLDFPACYSDFITALHRADLYRRGGNGGGREVMALSRVLVGRSPGICEVRRQILQVADAQANVLILGESGTGKEVVARSLHLLSSRREHPFVPVNCGAIPAELLESELFGHEKGAFTGALTARQGRFEIAEGGTLFLDEIGDMPLPMQVKLLRVIQERTFERVGSNRSLSADVRIIAATHRDLEQCIAAGDFREDLYYRLNVFPIELPPLRERREDIDLLAHELIARMEHEGRGAVRLTRAALDSLREYPWPGNVRELANLMERLVIMFPFGVVDYGDLPPKFRAEGIEPDPSVPMPELPAPEPDTQGPSMRLPEEGLDLKAHLAEMEKRLIEQALEQSGGVVARAAKHLRMRRTTLVEKVRKYGIDRTGEVSPS
jgi:sigma-54 specific flagellar transcriptional regulator A